MGGLAAAAGLLYGFTAAIPIPPAAAAQPATWNFSQANIPAAQALGNYGAGVLVAVVDTWVDFNHPDFGGRVIDEADCVSGTCQDHTYAPDACQHGTHVSGTIASSNYGVAPDAEILAVQVLTYDPSNGECDGSTSAVAAGIDFAVAHHAQVINLSLGDLIPGLTQSSDVTTAVQQAAQAGVVMVVAAGNDSVPLTDDYGDSAVLVAASGPSGRLASYSDYGGSVNLAAPGGDDGMDGLADCATSDCVLSTWPPSNYSTDPHGAAYGLMEGTSMAAPHVSGTAALLLSQDPSRGRANVIQALESTARPLAEAGSGLLDAGAALALRPESTSGRPAPTTTVPSAPRPAPTAPASGVHAASNGSSTSAPSSRQSFSQVVSAPPTVRATEPVGQSPPKLANDRPASPPLVPNQRSAPPQVGTSKQAAGGGSGNGGGGGGGSGHHAPVWLAAVALAMIGAVLVGGSKLATTTDPQSAAAAGGAGTGRRNLSVRRRTPS